MAATDDDAGGMLPQVTVGEQADSAAVETEKAAPEAAQFVKTREAVRRPPPPAATLYDAFERKPVPVLRRSAAADPPAGTPAATSVEDARLISLDSQMAPNADALAALEVWSTMGKRRKPRS